MADTELERCLKECVNKDKEVISNLKELVKDIEAYRRAYNIAKTTGTVAGAVGTGALAAMFLLAPFTGGMSLLGGVGLGALLLGGATNIITDIYDTAKTKSIMAKVREIVKSKEPVAAALKKQTDVLDEMVKKLEAQGISSDVAFTTVLHGLVNGVDTSPNSSIYYELVAKGAQGYALYNSKLLSSGIELATHDMELVETLLAGGAKTVGGVLKNAGKIFVPLSVVLTAVDIGFLIKDWATVHPTVPVINEIIGTLTKEVDQFEKFLTAIDSLKQRIRVSTVEGVGIVGNNIQSIEAVTALLNQDIQECTEQLHKLKIDWPFKDDMDSLDFIIKFINDNGIAKGFDMERLREIVKVRGKKAQKAILVLVENLINNIPKVGDKQGEDSKRSKRGEHVINNNVLYVYRDIIDAFIRRRFGNNVPDNIMSGRQISNDYHNAFTSEIRTNIQTRMVAHIPNDIPYFDTNAAIYGSLIYILRESCLLHMDELYNDPSLEGSDHTTRIRTTVLQVNQQRAYIDEVALQYWLGHGGSNITFEQSRQAVQSMFLNLYDKLGVWVQEMKTVQQ